MTIVDSTFFKKVPTRKTAKIPERQTGVLFGNTSTKSYLYTKTFRDLWPANLAKPNVAV